MSIRRICLIVSLLAAVTVLSGQVQADDWPQWNGPTRDGVVPVGLPINRIPEAGLQQVWSQPVDMGYAGPVIADGRVYVTDYVKTSGVVTNNAGKRDHLDGVERVTCLVAATGEKVWSHQYDCPYDLSYPGGPRATPLVHAGRLYTLGSEGDLVCYDASKGDVVWQRSFKNEYQSETPLWGHAASPLVFEDTLICLVGGPGSLVVAFDLESGQEEWKTGDANETGYCPPMLVDFAGIQQLVIWEPDMIRGMNPRTGEAHWQHPLKPDYGMSILPPVQQGDLLFAGGEGNVSTMFRLKKASDADGVLKAEIVWDGQPKTSLCLATSAAVFTDGHLFGADLGSGALVCADASDGRRRWQTARPTTGSDRERGAAHGSAFLMKLGGSSNYLILSETGDLISAKLTPAAYEETGRFHAIDPTTSTMGRMVLWTYPAIADGCIFVRNDRELKCFRLAP